MVYDTMYSEKIQDVFSKSIDSVRVMSLFTRRQSSENMRQNACILCAKTVVVYTKIVSEAGAGTATG